MNAKIYKINKSFLTEIDSIEMQLPNVSSMVIQHLFDGTLSGSSDLPFELDVSKKHVPFLNDPEFMVVIKERVDVTSQGPYDEVISNSGEDFGRYNARKSKPRAPWALPNGFTELKGKDE